VSIPRNQDSLNIVLLNQDCNCEALVKGKTSILQGKSNLFDEIKEAKHFIKSHPFLFSAQIKDSCEISKISSGCPTLAVAIA